MPDNEKPIKKEPTDEELIKEIRELLVSLNDKLGNAGRRDMSIQVTMITIPGITVPTFRLESAYKRIDSPLIARL